jgi:hypothetical protein
LANTYISFERTPIRDGNVKGGANKEIDKDSQGNE